MVGGAVAPLRINQASADPRFQSHPGLMLYGIESYIAVPLNRRDGSYFGTLCALDPLPAELSDDHFDVFHLLAQLIAFELEADEQQRHREAEQRALEDFIAIAAHDLRQPLTILQGKAELLARRARRGADPDDLVRRAEELLVQTRRAVALGDVVLDLARLEAGSLTLEFAQFDLVALATQIQSDAQSIAPKHHFVLNAPATLPIAGDERRIGQVLRNLLDNAVKYAPAARGPVVLTISADPQPGATEQINLSVCDAGLGVADEELPRLFERQYRAPQAVARRIGGSGLGLYIAQQIVEAHSGTIRAEHAAGGGLCVRLTLPRQAPANDDPAAS